MRITSNVMDLYSLRQNSVVRLECEKSKKKKYPELNRVVMQNINFCWSLSQLHTFGCCAYTHTHQQIIHIQRPDPLFGICLRCGFTLTNSFISSSYLPVRYSNIAQRTPTHYQSQQKNQKHELYVYVVYFCSPGWPLLVACVYE